MGQGTNFDGGRELALLKQQNPLLGSLVNKLIGALNRLGNNISVSPTGELPSPSPVDSLDVKGTLSGTTMTVPGEILHSVATHNSELARGMQYVWEVSPNDPNFANPHPLDTGAGRTLQHVLPSKDDNGTIVTYYLRVTPQLHGSAPAKPTVFGTAGQPIGIQMGGNTSMSLLSSQGAGTAFPGQGGQGLGKVLVRPAAGPKRAL